MIVEAIAAFIALLAAILPPIIAAWARQSAIDRKEADALVRRSNDSLHTILDRVHAQQTKSPVQPGGPTDVLR